MSNTLKSYEPSNPAEATTRMRSLRTQGFVCPLCRRTSKWRYYYAETSEIDNGSRCTIHEMVPIPGPDWEPESERVGQLY